MKLLYFAWIREKIGKSEEAYDCPESVSTVKQLMDDLQSRGGGYEEAFSDESVVRVAVNHDYAQLNDSINPSDEIAFFPPVTGG